MLEKDAAIKKAHEHFEKELKNRLDILKRQSHILNVERVEHLTIDSKLIAAKEGIKRLLDRLKKSLNARYKAFNTLENQVFIGAVRCCGRQAAHKFKAAGGMRNILSRKTWRASGDCC